MDMVDLYGKEEIKAFPERFSPNVVMRPLYQEVVLPNLAYVGGGGELAYWLQLKANFDFYKVDFPLLILRNSAMLADEKVEHKLERLNLSFTEIFKESESLKKAYVKKYSPHDLSLQDEWKQLSKSLVKQSAKKWTLNSNKKMKFLQHKLTNDKSIE